MDYLKIAEVAEKWGVTPRRIQKLCLDGKIDGAVRFGRAWMIPKDAKKPSDGRTKESRTDTAAEHLTFPKNTPFLYMTDIYSTPGKAEEYVEKFSDNHIAKVIIAYTRLNVLCVNTAVEGSLKYCMLTVSALFIK